MPNLFFCGALAPRLATAPFMESRFRVFFLAERIFRGFFTFEPPDFFADFVLFSV